MMTAGYQRTAACVPLRNGSLGQSLERLAALLCIAYQCAARQRPVLRVHMVTTRVGTCPDILFYIWLHDDWPWRSQKRV